MIYLYFDTIGHILHLFTKPEHMGNTDDSTLIWENIETVTADKERGQVCAHALGKGIVAEFPLGKTVLTCQKPLN